MSKTKKNLLFMLCFALIMLVAAAFSAFNANKAQAADVTADDFKVASIGIRLQDNAAETGVRFGVQINEELLNKADAKVTLYMLPQMFYVSGAHLNACAATAQSVEIPGTGWAGENGYKTAYAYVYDFPANNYGVKLLAEACLTYTENGATVSKWTAVSDAYSLTDVAKIAQEGGKTGADGYIIDQVKITYKNADGTIIGSETPDYGATLNYPAAAVIKNKTQRGWVTSKSTPWNSSWTAQGNMTLTASYVTGGIVAEKMYSTSKNGNKAYESAAKIALPEGYEKVWQAPLDSNGQKHGMYMPSNDLSEYSEVNFAIKTGASYAFGGSVTTVKKLNNWIYFSLTQNSTGTWNLTVTSDETVVWTAENLTANYNAGEYTKGAITAILYGDPKKGYTPIGAKNENFYFTELRGVKKPVGEIISDRVYGAKKSGILSEKEVTDMPSPEGFEKVWSATAGSQGTGYYYLRGEYYSPVVISDYEEVHFAVKTGYQYRFDTETKPITDWMLFSLKQNEDGTWALTVTTLDGKILHTASGLTSNKSGGDYVAGSLNVILYGNTKSSGYIPIVKEKNGVFYFTELRGVKKK